MKEDDIDFSWMLIAVDRFHNGWILDASEGFWDCDMFDGTSVEDNGILMADDLPVGVYKVTKIKISRGGPDNNGEYWGTEISGKWNKLDIVKLKVYGD